MGYIVTLTPRAAKNARKLSAEVRKRIKSKLKQLEENPERIGQSLTGTRYHKTRIGDYRAIYHIKRNEKRINVVYVGHRSTVYDDFQKFL